MKASVNFATVFVLENTDTISGDSLPLISSFLYRVQTVHSNILSFG